MRLLQFTIRDLLWLMVVVSFYLGWCIERREAVRQQFVVREKLATLVTQMENKNSQIDSLQQSVNNVSADERAARERLAEFVATQDDQARVDVAPGLFHRVASPH